MAEVSEIGSIKALLDDARNRIKESEDRSSKKIDEVEKRFAARMDELETLIDKINLRIIEWMPILTELSKNQESKKNITIALIVSFITNVAAWVLAAFVFFVKSGVIK